MKRLITIFTLAITLSWSISWAGSESPTWSVYFSPNGGCTEAVIREVDKAKTSVLVPAYSFTSALPVLGGMLSNIRSPGHGKLTVC
jgi:hypothetical protein